MADPLPIHRLEQYTLRHPQEVLLVRARLAGEPDQVMIFRGFSSALMRSTAFDPAVPVLPAEATLETLDRLQSPYTPTSPQYLEQDIPWETFQARLADEGL